ncbi:MAG TPA: RNA methyltransferase [Bacteroidetes bacterium]|nr:RNA methyltransferase [Bacteroidota bacterium]
MTDTATPQDIVALARIPERRQPGARLLVLDGLSDPGNVGTIIRTAAWFGVSDIVLHGHGVDPYAPKVVRSAAGALFRSNIIEELDVMFDGRPILVSEPFGGAPPSQIADLPSWALVIGSEAHGVSDILRKRATQSVTIPGGHGTESLNAAIAASILLYEATR